MSTDTHCYHCHQPITTPGRWQSTVFGQVRAMCCAGCAAVADTIVANGLEHYYQTRQQCAYPLPETIAPLADLQLFDAPEILPRYSAPASPTAHKDSSDTPQIIEADLMIEGLRCAACVWLIEQHLRKQLGIKGIHVNFSAHRIHVQWNPEQMSLSKILQHIQTLGYVAQPYDRQQHTRYQQQQQRHLFKQWFVAGIGMMQVMMYAWPAYMTDAGEIEADYAALLRWASLLLTLPVVLYSARDFLVGAWRDLAHRRVGMDVPVALGILAAFIASIWHTWLGQGDVYFDSITMFVFLLLSGRWLEQRVRAIAVQNLNKLAMQQPTTAHRCVSYPNNSNTETIPAQRLQVGEPVLVKQGEAFPADLKIIQGQTQIDQALLTGEAHLLPRKIGDECPGGAINQGQAIIGRVLRHPQESTLSHIERLAIQAQQYRPQLALLTDRIAAWFVFALLVFTGATALIWWQINPNQALPIAIALLVVSCPCALSLATPAALAASSASLLKQGVLVCRADALEKLAKSTDIVFDKTGTLTETQRTLLHIDLLMTTAAQSNAGTIGTALTTTSNTQGFVLNIAAALEQNVHHPIAHSIQDAWQAYQKQHANNGHAQLNFQDCEVFPGRGVAGRLGETSYRIGQFEFVAELAALPRDKHAHQQGVWLARAGEWLARFEFSDALRPHATALIQHVQQHNIVPHLFSGDQCLAVQKVAQQLGIDHAQANMTPDQKLQALQALQKQGRCVAMVGDGSNDAPIISGADISIAMGQGAPLAQLHADMILLSNDLGTLDHVFVHAKYTMRIIRQNFWWATLYNLTAIPAAAFGLISPWVAALGMSLSSLLVVLNALRLLNKSTKQPTKQPTKQLSSLVQDRAWNPSTYSSPSA